MPRASRDIDIPPRGAISGRAWENIKVSRASTSSHTHRVIGMTNTTRHPKNAAQAPGPARPLPPLGGDSVGCRGRRRTTLVEDDCRQHGEGDKPAGQCRVRRFASDATGARSQILGTTLQRFRASRKTALGRGISCSFLPNIDAHGEQEVPTHTLKLFLADIFRSNSCSKATQNESPVQFCACGRAWTTLRCCVPHSQSLTPELMVR
jgi:hypothetical protein